MLSTRKVWLSLLAAVAALAAAPANAQDFPALGADPQHTGRNSNPALYGPGIANLVWFWPNGLTRPGAVIRNNTSNQVTRFGTWNQPAVTEEAGFPYVGPRRTASAAYNDIIGATNTFPAYEYAYSVPSNVGSHDNPVLGATASFTWTLDPLLDNAATPNGFYQLYVWLPAGPTGPLGGPGGGLVYPNRYLVYEIISGNGQRTLDVVDTEVSGQGWVRLGNGGRPTNAVFPYQGTPITVRLYNTEYRDGFDNLLDGFANDVTRVVYADAVMAVPDNGYYTAGPVVKQIDTGTGLRNEVVAARNVNSAVIESGNIRTITTSEVAAFFHDGSGPSSNAPIWHWSPAETSPNSSVMDNTDPGVTVDPGWAISTLTNHFGANYYTNTITNTAAGATFVTYQPTLDDGDYLIQVYVGGDSGAEVFAHSAVVYVTESDGTVTQVPIDQSVAGWVTLSNQRFKQRTALGNLRVQISNYSANAADANLLAYADEVRFIGAFNLQVNSTPTMARATITLAGGGTADKDVVVVTSDDGHIYCLDATGNGNGTTTVYWAYPSILPAGTNDPNDAANQDGVGIRAQMPTDAGFGDSSPVVARIGTADYCFVAARNGRVYSIEMAGRGDYNTATGLIGTTSRKWSWPDDYPALRRPALQGGFGASVAFDDSGAVPTVYVPASEGRIYALNATGNFNRTTDIRWNYPLVTDPTLGAITTNPTVAFGNVYFGTARASDFVPGQFYALNANTGALKWVFEGDAVNDVEADVFSGGAATATSAQLGIANNMIFCSNQNLRIYGLDADTGALLWRTAELNTTVTAPLTFNVMAVPNLVGTVVAEPVVMVPSDNGRFDALFARPAVVNVDNGRLAWEYVAGSDSVQAPMSVGWNFMFGGDMSGNLYAWGNVAAIGGMGPPPGSPSLPPNDVNTAQYRNAKMTLITKQGYQQLRLSSAADPDLGVLTKAQALALTFNRNPLAFEWGETAYFLVYDFPAPPADNPTIVQFQIGVEGAAVRQFGVQAKKFVDTGDPLEGYAILAFPLNTGPTSIPPGEANVRYSFTIDNPSNPGQQVNVPITRTFPFRVLNPLGIIMPIPGTNQAGTGTQSFGINSGPTSFGDFERIRNGTPNNPNPALTQGSRLANTEGVVGNGQTGVGSFYVVDMSMMTLLRGNGIGLSGVRMNRPSLVWQGGAFAVLKPIDQLLYPGYEDLPVNHPNLSLDYPDIGRENIRATKDPNGTAENMTLAATGVTLTPPKLPSNYDDSMLTSRSVVPVLCQLEVDVPRFQPANNSPSRYFLDSSGNTLASGYLGRVSVFVDANGNNVLDSVSGRREPFRAFTTNLAVALDERLDVTTPTVDLGSLAEGTGYSPFRPNQAAAGVSNTFSPWENAVGVTYPPTTIVSSNSDYVNVFQPFRVENLGNVNLLNVRLATGVSGGPYPGPWPIYSNSVDDLGWLDSREYVYTNFDYLFGLMPQILLQKARVGDRFPTDLSTNPVRRLNQNLGVVEGLLFPNGPIGTAAAPRVGVTPPIGAPVGIYSQRMEVIEDSIRLGVTPYDFAYLDQSSDSTLNYPTLESFSDPTFTLKFTVREARATTAFTKATAAMVDVPQASPNALGLTYANLQPGGYRTTAGDLVMGFTSSRANFNDPMPATPIVDPQYRIYIATLNGQPPSNSFSSPLGELGYATPTGNQWFRQAAGPFPNLANYDALFQTGAGESVIAGSEKFGAPAFPAYGVVNPLPGGQNFGSTIMAFVGTAQKQTPSGRTSESRIMAANVTVANDGSVTVDNLQAMPFDPNTNKSKPSIYQVTGGAAILYSGAGTGEGQLFYTAYNGSTFGRPTIIPVGSGFEEVGAPNAQPRMYSGLGGNTPIVELTFVGKLRGRPNSEVFYGRLGTKTDNGVGNMPGQALILPPRVKEDLVPDADQGTYRAQGVVWDTRPNATIKVYESLDGVNNIDLEPVGATRTIDRASGLIRFDTKLGGQVYIDPNLGTVRFANSLPPKNAVIRLDYAPRFLRVSESTVAGHATPTVLWDDRIAGDVSSTSYWFRVASDGSVSNVSTSATPHTARYFYTYTRAAAGAGQAARPFWKSMRMGVKLNHPIYTDQGGNVVGLNIGGLPADAPVQVDPAHGLIFFQASEENKTLTINYTASDAAGTAFAAPTETPTVGVITERSETPVPIDQAINESWITTFIDPFDLNPRRPGLIWMYFSSTRTGASDIYFQAMAPRFTPLIKQ